MFSCRLSTHLFLVLTWILTPSEPRVTQSNRRPEGWDSAGHTPHGAGPRSWPQTQAGRRLLLLRRRLAAKLPEPLSVNACGTRPPGAGQDDGWQCPVWVPVPRASSSPGHDRTHGAEIYRPARACPCPPEDGKRSLDKVLSC